MFTEVLRIEVRICVRPCRFKILIVYLRQRFPTGSCGAKKVGNPWSEAMFLLFLVKVCLIEKQLYRNNNVFNLKHLSVNLHIRWTWLSQVSGRRNSVHILINTVVRLLFYLISYYSFYMYERMCICHAHMWSLYMYMHIYIYSYERWPWYAYMLCSASYSLHTF